MTERHYTVSESQDRVLEGRVQGGRHVLVTAVASCVFGETNLSCGEVAQVRLPAGTDPVRVACATDAAARCMEETD